MSISIYPQELKDHEKFLKDLIRYKSRRLRELQLKEAKYGLNTPVEILTEIADLKGEIEDSKEELMRVSIQIEEDEKNRVKVSSQPIHSAVKTQLTVNPPAVPRPINLSFDGPTSFGMPTGWFNSLGFVSNVSVDYKIEVVSRPDNRGGACVLFQNLQATKSEFGSLMQRCLAQSLAGKIIRLEGEVKTSKIEDWAGLWLRADGERIPDLLFDNMSKNPIRGSTTWKKYTIEAQLPKETIWLNYGIVLAGRGVMWADNFRLMVWKEGLWADV